jgi:hypothetical protein
MAHDYVAVYEQMVRERAPAVTRDVADFALSQGAPLDPPPTFHPEETAGSGSA